MTHEKYVVVIVTYNRKALLHECVRQVEAQTIPADTIIIVNNASTDGTELYLAELSACSRYCIINCTENVGGSGGFARGLARAVTFNTDCILLIDDDAMLSPDYMEKLLHARILHPEYRAFAGSVVVDGEIDTCHRKILSCPGLFFKDCKKFLYKNAFFLCDIASFCGMLVDREVAVQIGLPHEKYFIWHDDAEYSLRVHRFSRFLVIPDAILNHRTRLNSMQKRPRRYEWRDYYAIRNRIWMLWEHGSLLDRAVNFTDLFVRVILRNWLFSVLRVDRHDWKYEKNIVQKALKDTGKIAERPWQNLKQHKYT